MIGKDYICSIMQNKGVIMTTLELEEKKKKLLKDIENVDNVELLEELQRVVSKLTRKTTPCQFTKEELVKQIHQSEMELNGGLGIPHEEVRKRFLK